ncbi:MAG TPA: ATP synthase F1 subunit epsilon [Myxococcota bacterium]|jgi:F-type H+-transporting ATPase subunit epsilon
MPFHLTVVTPEGEAFNRQVEGVVLPGSEGEFGVLTGHEPFLTALAAGPLQIAAADERLFAAVGRGFAEIHGDAVSVLVGSCEFAHEIDRSRAEIARDRALTQLTEMRGTAEGEAAYEALQDAYSRAVARIAVSDKFKA